MASFLTFAPRLGTVIRSGAATADAIRQLLPLGFESWQIVFALKREAVPPLDRLADEVNAVVQGSGTVVSALGVYGNPLRCDEVGGTSRAAIRAAMAAAPRMGTDLVCCFAGRVPGASVPDSIPRFRDVWSELAAEAADRGVRVAFENCLQGGTWEAGDWNIAHNPAAWERMFDVVPSPALGLEWEPAHQLCQLIDPLPQLRAWAHRIFHIHGKDALVDRGVIAQSGVYGAARFAWHRFPSFGDTDWSDVLRILQAAGYCGNIDIEGFHDPVFHGEREIEGQTRALEYLKTARTAATS